MTARAGRQPEECVALARFGLIQGRTSCLYAPSSRLWGAPSWVAGASEDLNLASTAQAFAHFAAESAAQALDGFVVMLPAQGYGATLAELAAATKRLLVGLSAADPAGQDCMRGDPERVDWHFRFAGQRHYVIAFAPCYGPTSSRFAFGVEGTFFLFQPEHAFERRVPPGSTVIPPSERSMIRRKFAAQGRAYDLSITLSPNEAIKIVKPLEFGDPLVRWWE